MSAQVTSKKVEPGPIGFQPGLDVEDVQARHWLMQVTLRLRREVAWLWHERGVLQGMPDPGGMVPPMGDPLTDALDLTRYDADRARFFAEDPTAAYLTERLNQPAPGGAAKPGGFAWLAGHLELDGAERLVLALALGGAVDSARGSVIAACQNGPKEPTLALAQRLWDNPGAVLPLLDPGHVLVRLGILAPVPDWDAPLHVPPVVARQLLFPEGALPEALVQLPVPVAPEAESAAELAAARLKARAPGQPCYVPLCGPQDGAFADTAARIGRQVNLGVAQITGAAGGGALQGLMSVAWLRGLAVLVPLSRLNEAAALPGVPLVVFVAMSEGEPLTALPQAQTLGRVHLRPLGYAARLEAWRRCLPSVWSGEAGQALLAECARRFQIEARAIERIAAAVLALDRTVDRDSLFAACRADLELGELAQEVKPRFQLDELMLPPKQARQVDDLIRAVGALSTVHHEWGAARAWNEAGLSVLFAGPPGTGKTMAAEAIAVEVGMPMVRIDLSQVVNKYIGETEKNLRRLFDAADCGDVILFFDEADALFGKRTEVKDAHDRYANLEVSYLLERMERFRGMAILASNCKKDLDEAFLRRLRTIVNFPLPEAAERLRIWQGMMPEGVETGGLDLKFLADNLPLSGGHIRSAVFNACLQCAARDGPARLEMGALVRAVKQEFDKLGRTVSLNQFGPYAQEIADER